MEDVAKNEISPLYRWWVLLFVSLLTYGSYFAYDSIGAISTMLMKALHITHQDIGLMYSLYSWPNIVMVFFGGLLIDKIGTRKASMIFSTLIVIGATLVATAINFKLMLLGRFIFGIGSESLVVAQSAILAKWFKGRELAMAFGIALTISRLGTLITFNTEAKIANYFNSWKMALWAAAFFCLLSFLSNVVYVILDKKAEKAGILTTSIGEGEAVDKIVLSDVKKLNAPFWYITLLCVTFYSAIFPFTAFSSDFFHEKWNFTLSTSGTLTSIIIFFSMCLAPFLGRLVDKVGKRATMMMIGSLMMIPCHLLMGISYIHPAIPMAILGLSFSLVPAAMWPSVPLIVEEKIVGTAFGLMTMVQNIGLALFPLVIGKLRDVTHDYTAGMIVFSFLGLFGLFFAIMLKRSDRKFKCGLENPGLK